MLLRVKQTGHDGPEFVHTKHFSNFKPGDLVGLNDEKLEQMIIDIHFHGRTLAALFAMAIFPKGLGTIY